MARTLVGKEAFFLGSVFYVVLDPKQTDLVTDLEKELDFIGKHGGPAAMYGTVKSVDLDGNIKVRMLTAAGCTADIDDNTTYTFEVPRAMYVVVSRSR